MTKAYLDASNSVVDVIDFAYDDNHVLQIVKTGTVDLDAEIQSFSDSCGMDFVLRSVAAGDMSVLNRRSGAFGDFSNAPQSLAEVQSQQEVADQMYSNLPDTIKNGRSAQDVIQLTAEQLDDYIKKAVDAQIIANKTNSEVNNNEQ